MTKAKPEVTSTEDEITARLAAREAETRKDAELSLPTLRRMAELAAETEALLTEMVTLSGRLLMPTAAMAFRNLAQFGNQAVIVMDVTKGTLSTMIAQAEAIVAPPADEAQDEE